MNMTINRTYCNGRGCLLKDMCRLYVDGLAVYTNRQGDTDQHRWMDNCDPETRELFISTDN